MNIRQFGWIVEVRTSRVIVKFVTRVVEKSAGDLTRLSLPFVFHVCICLRFSFLVSFPCFSLVNIFFRTFFTEYLHSECLNLTRRKRTTKTARLQLKTFHYFCYYTGLYFSNYTPVKVHT